MDKYGYITLIAGRFLPIMHSLAPLLSGVAKTPIVPFMIVNVVGGVLWVLSASLSGYYIGQVVPHAQYFAIPFVFVLAVYSNSALGRRHLRTLASWLESI
jgi:membrane-associated protein